MTLALFSSTSENFQREVEVHPWFPFQPGEPETQPREDAVMLHEGVTGKPTWAKMDGWMDRSAPLNIRKS